MKNAATPELQFLAPRPLTSLHVFYDGHCALCCAIRNWLARQPALVEMTLIPHQNPRAWEIFPPLRRLDSHQDIIILTNTGHALQGAEALVACLESLSNFPRLAAFLSRPRPLALFSKAWATLSKKRHLLSRLFFASPRDAGT
jgi:predicted DCC family thiol-disulfide oxidoreductase YuxK